jgi:hypothetical protein
MQQKPDTAAFASPISRVGKIAPDLKKACPDALKRTDHRAEGCNCPRSRPTRRHAGWSHCVPIRRACRGNTHGSHTCHPPPRPAAVTVSIRLKCRVSNMPVRTPRFLRRCRSVCGRRGLSSGHQTLSASACDCAESRPWDSFTALKQQHFSRPSPGKTGAHHCSAKSATNDDRLVIQHRTQGSLLDSCRQHAGYPLHRVLPALTVNAMLLHFFQEMKSLRAHVGFPP